MKIAILVLISSLIGLKPSESIVVIVTLIKAMDITIIHLLIGSLSLNVKILNLYLLLAIDNKINIIFPQIKLIKIK